MERRFTLTVLACLLFGVSSQLSAQETSTPDSNSYRTYDGTYNNLANPRWGAVGDLLVRLAPVGYEDRVSIPSGTRRPNPRDVSNILFSQPRLMNDPHSLSDYVWVFGQFIDHDLGLTPDGDEVLNIPVRSGDAWMDPFRTGSVVIPSRRNVFDPGTGTGPDNPRQHPNFITAFIDGSGVYGSDVERANWLRSFEGGKLRVSEGNLLPYNTTTGERDAPVDHDAPEMDNPVRLTDKLFVAGDARANENPLLASFHTLFVREHNRLCDELTVAHPEWDDEQLYQHARKIVGGKIQAIVYEEWLPTMGIELEPYTGYKPDVNPQLMNEFTAAGFRVGHTLLNGNLRMLQRDGHPMPTGDLGLRDVFFNPESLVAAGGLEPFLQGMASQKMQTFDSKIVDDVRNFLFGPPGAGGLDLAAININRGRDRGLPDYNTIREALGLHKYVYFAQINSHMDVFARMMVVYQQLYKLDPWVGMLAESPLRGSIFGETLQAMMRLQFTNLRDGDRFYYENDPLLSEQEKQEIKATRMRDILMKNTDIYLMQQEVFRATEPDEICEEIKGDLNLMVQTEEGSPVSSVEISMNEEMMAMTDERGMGIMEGMGMCKTITISASKSDDIKNGVTTLDYLLVQKHILGQELLDSPYKIIAADVDDSKSISLMDLITLRRIALGSIQELPSGKDVWRFVDGEYAFDNPVNPLQEDYPVMVMEVNMAEHLDYSPMHIMAIKMGDVDNSALSTESGISGGIRTAGQLPVVVEDIKLESGKSYMIPLQMDALPNLEGLQLTLKYQTRALELTNVYTAEGVMMDENLSTNPDRGLIAASWSALGADSQPVGKKLLSLEFKALQSGDLSSYLELSEAPTPPEAYGKDGSMSGMNLEFTAVAAKQVAMDNFVLLQNEPNPFKEKTFIGFALPAESAATLRVFDVQGRLLHQETGIFGAGQNGFSLDRSQLSDATGFVYYQLETSFGAASKKMLLVD